MLITHLLFYLFNSFELLQSLSNKPDTLLAGDPRDLPGYVMDCHVSACLKLGEKVDKIMIKTQ